MSKFRREIQLSKCKGPAHGEAGQPSLRRPPRVNVRDPFSCEGREHLSQTSHRSRRLGVRLKMKLKTQT